VLLATLLIGCHKTDEETVSSSTIMNTINGQIGLSRFFERMEALEARHEFSAPLNSESLSQVRLPVRIDSNELLIQTKGKIERKSPSQDLARKGMRLPQALSYTGDHGEFVFDREFVLLLQSLRQRAKQHALDIFATCAVECLFQV